MSVGILYVFSPFFFHTSPRFTIRSNGIYNSRVMVTKHCLRVSFSNKIVTFCVEQHFVASSKKIGNYFMELADFGFIKSSCSHKCHGCIHCDFSFSLYYHFIPSRLCRTCAVCPLWSCDHAIMRFVKLKTNTIKFNAESDSLLFLCMFSVHMQSELEVMCLFMNHVK